MRRHEWSRGLEQCRRAPAAALIHNYPRPRGLHRLARLRRSALEALRAAEAAVGEAVSEAELGEGDADGEAGAQNAKGAAGSASTSLPVAVAELRRSLTGWEARAEAISQTVREAESRGVAGGMLEQGRAEAARLRCAGLMAAEMEDLQRRRCVTGLRPRGPHVV